MTDREHSVDVLSAWPKTELDPLVALIEDLVATYGETIIQYVKLSREQRGAQTECSADRAAIAARGVLWPKFKLECKKR